MCLVASRLPADVAFRVTAEILTDVLHVGFEAQKIGRLILTKRVYLKQLVNFSVFPAVDSSHLDAT